MVTSKTIIDPAREIRQNAEDLENELAWFARILDTRFKLYFGHDTEYQDVFDITPPDLGESSSQYARFIRHYELSPVERLTLITSLVPHIRPQLLDVFYTKNQTFDRRFTEFGGVWRGPDGDFQPTGDTVAFLLGGADLETRFRLRLLFDPQHVFARHGILRLEPVAGRDQPVMKCPLHLATDYISLFTTGRAMRPALGVDFPAQYIETQLDWSDLVLHPGTRKQIEEIQTWMEYGEVLMKDWGMGAKLRPGHRSLFYGPPGTGKTMTACLLGKSTGRDVYRIDLSLVVSKYIGETEKNLARVFDQAQHKNWILFFDEADALFGKRSETKDARDRYANQEISFLLQRIETFDGIAILASNLRENLDDAFTRRFESVIYFPLPRPEERLLLWQRGFSPKATLDEDVDLDEVSRDHDLSGGTIMNVIRYVSILSLEDGQRPITMDDIFRGIRRELAKEGKAS